MRACTNACSRLAARALLLESGFTTGEEGAGLGERLLCSRTMALEFLIQGLKCLGLGLERIPLRCQHPRSRVLGSVAGTIVPACQLRVVTDSFKG
jgi:hypothetical protein